MTDPAHSAERLIEALVPAFVASGLTSSQLSYLVRHALVREAAKQLRLKNGRTNHSQVAAATGLGRAEVGQILRSPLRSPAKQRTHLPESPSDRIVSKWQCDPRYCTRGGVPKALPIRGRGDTLEKLLRECGGDLYPATLVAELKRQGRIRVAGNRAHLSVNPARSRKKSMLIREQAALLDLLTSIAVGWDSESVVRAVSLRASDRLESRLLHERAESILDGAVGAIQSLGTVSVLRGKTRRNSKPRRDQFLILSLTRNLKRTGGSNG